MSSTTHRLNLNARKRRGLATVYRVVLQNMHDLNVRLTPDQVAEFSEAMCWLSENTKEQRDATRREFENVLERKRRIYEDRRL